jgi:hypothetical protein
MSNFDFKKPHLGRFDFTDLELATALRYTRVREVVMPDAPDAHTAWLVIGNQSFTVGPAYETREEADWMCWMLAKALISVREDIGPLVPVSAEQQADARA